MSLFTLTPEQHRMLAQYLRRVGQDKLADQHELVAEWIEQARDNEAATAASTSSIPPKSD
jgi:hypothetical protein